MVPPGSNIDNMSDVKCTGAATVLGVNDIEAALDFYVDKLGFEQTFQYGDPCFYVGLKFGEAMFHLNANKESAQLSSVYIFVEGVKDYYNRVLSMGIEPADELKEYPYGMTDFDLIDPFGNVLTFGENSSQS